MTKDPIKFAHDEMNLYGYAGTDPINHIDPLGLDCYAPCEGRGCIGKWICKKGIDWACSGPKEIVCCEAEKTECQSNVKADDPEADKKLLECNAKYTTCISHGGGSR
jgi:hypothetical protein